MPGSDPSPHPPKTDRFRSYWLRHRTLFWNLHSVWALAGGGIVIFLANERYGFVPWVILFLILTWTSTLLFSRTTLRHKGASRGAEPPNLRGEVGSYLTRAMYQGTLFFLLPFYWYSTVGGSLNVVFSAILVGLAVISCLDLVFDRWLRMHPWFGFVYFATVTFAAINLLLPLLFPVDPATGTPLAALVAVGSALPLALRSPKTRFSSWVPSVLLAVLFLLIVVTVPRLVPPVPLRIRNPIFASAIDRETLEPADRLQEHVSSERVQDELFILVDVFAPSVLPASVTLEWTRDGELIRTSRPIEITAHSLGFRLWDGYRPRNGKVPPGRYKVSFRTTGQRWFGSAEISVDEE